MKHFLKTFLLMMFESSNDLHHIHVGSCGKKHYLLIRCHLKYSTSCLDQPFEKDMKFDVWKVYKEALEDRSAFLDCWDVLVGDLKNRSHPPTSNTKSHYEDFSSKMAGLWAMIKWDGANVQIEG